MMKRFKTRLIKLGTFALCFVSLQTYAGFNLDFDLDEESNLTFQQLAKIALNKLEMKNVGALEFFLRDTIYIGKVDYWSKFQRAEFHYVVNYKVTRKTEKFLYETIRPLKVEFLTKGYQMLKNLNLPQDTLFDCAYAGRIDWCMEALDLMQDIVLDLSDVNLYLISMSTFEMYCFVRDGNLHLHIPNTYDRETIVKNIHRCFLDDDSIHSEELMSVPQENLL